MSGIDTGWAEACRQAKLFLRRYGDAASRRSRDDLVQETALAAWQWRGRMRDAGRLGAALRTIARRTRNRFVAAERRRSELLAAVLAERSHAPGEALPAAEPRLCIAGREVEFAWARARLEQALQRLSPLDRQLLLAFHEGFCCAELAERCGRSEQCVKARIHRARRRVRKELEGIVRAAGALDP